MIGASAQAGQEHRKKKNIIRPGPCSDKKGDAVQKGAKDQYLFFTVPVREQTKGQIHYGISNKVYCTEKHNQTQFVQLKIIPDGKIQGRENKIKGMV